MHTLVGSATGTGKSYAGQAVIEFNLKEGDFDGLVVLDYKDEFRGLVKAGFAKHWLVGEKEAEFGPDEWAKFIQQSPHVVLARHDLNDEQWREVCDNVVAGLRKLALDVLVAVDEAHTVAPQVGNLAENIRWLAQTGRSDGKSAIWITQKLSEIDKVVISQSTAWMIGGFREENDLKKLAKVTDYNERAHKLGGIQLSSLPEELHAPDAGAVSVRLFEDEDGNTVGMEFIYSDRSGTMRRINTGEWEPEAPHYAAQGNKIHIPGLDE